MFIFFINIKRISDLWNLGKLNLNLHTFYKYWGGIVVIFKVWDGAQPIYV